MLVAGRGHQKGQTGRTSETDVTGGRDRGPESGPDRGQGQGGLEEGVAVIEDTGSVITVEMREEGDIKEGDFSSDQFR